MKAASTTTPTPPQIKRTSSGQRPNDEEDSTPRVADLSELGLAQEAEPFVGDEEVPSAHEQPDMPVGGVIDANIAFGQPLEKRVAPANAAEEREAAIATLKGKPLMQPGDANFFHGLAYDGPKVNPKVLWASDKKPRKDHDAPNWLTATEYEDTAEVTAAKVKRLAALMGVSRHTCVYSGAGISASAVGQAALSGVNKVGWLNKTEAQPTPTHHALAALGRTGWVHGWVQQNHDGLPQKAGFPQEAICEVHGSWYDPSNPVVKYTGSLKDYECEWMERETQQADLVLVMGTSLGGLFADQVATECAMRALSGVSLGACIINLQQTSEDDKMTLRFSGKSDDVLVRLLAELALPPLPKALHTVAWAKIERVLVPYDANGQRLPEDSTAPRMWLDLSRGAMVRLSKQHNHQGAKQPTTIHVGSRKGQTFHGKTIPNAGDSPGLGTSMGRDEKTASVKLNIENATMRLGIWWMESAARGGPPHLPIVNQRPEFEVAKAEAHKGKATAKRPAVAAGGGKKKST